MLSLENYVGVHIYTADKIQAGLARICKSIDMPKIRKKHKVQ